MKEEEEKEKKEKKEKVGLIMERCLEKRRVECRWGGIEG